MVLLSALCVSMACQSIKLGNGQCWQSWQLNVYIMHIYVLAWRMVKIFSFVHIFQQVVWYTSKRIFINSQRLYFWGGKRCFTRVLWPSWDLSDANALVSGFWLSVFGYSAIIFFGLLFDCLIWDQCRSRQQTNWETWQARDCFNNFDVITSQQSTVQSVAFWLPSGQFSSGPIYLSFSVSDLFI